MRNIYIDLSSDNPLQQPKVFGGYEGEHNETFLRVKLPKRMIETECTGYRFDFQISKDNITSSPLIPTSELDNDILSFHLPEQLTIAGDLFFNVVAITLDKDIVSTIGKTSGVFLRINNSPNGENVFLDPNGYKDELLKMVDDRILQLEPTKGEKGDPGVIKFTVVSELPEIGDESVIYLLESTNTQEQNAYDEYIFTNGVWEKVGTTSVAVDLTDYVKKTDYAKEGGILGLMTTAYNVWTSGLVLKNGMVSIGAADEIEIDSKNQNYRPIVPSNLDYAIKAGLSNNTLKWTEEEKQSARDLIGSIGSTDYATDDKAGLVKSVRSRGIVIDNEGNMNIDSAGRAEILAKINYRNPIVPNNLDYAVKVGMTTNSESWTDEEKQAARDLIGAIGEKTEHNGQIFNDYKTNKALSEHSTAFNTGNVAGTMGYEVGTIWSENTDIVTIWVKVPEGTVEATSDFINSLSGELVSLVAGNNYDCIGVVDHAYWFAETEKGFGVIIKLLDGQHVNWDTSKFPQNSGASGYFYFPKHPEVGNIVVNEAPAFAAGVGSVASQEGAAVFGEKCFAAGKRSFVAGRDNMAGYISAAFGRYNTIRGYYSFGSGYQNDVASSAERCAIFGYNNKVRSHNTVIEGNTNTDGYGQAIGTNHIEGTNNTIANGCYGVIHIEGEGNTVESDGQSSHIEGVRNTLKSGKVNHITGIQNTVTGGYNTVSGHLITVNGSYNDVGGSNNSVTGSSNFVRGSGHKVIGYEKTIFGKNAANDASALFIIGNGVDVNHEKNAFVVTNKGKAIVETPGEAGNEVVVYEQLKAALDRITELENQLASITNVAEVGQ